MNKKMLMVIGLGLVGLIIVVLIGSYGLQNSQEKPNHNKDESSSNQRPMIGFSIDSMVIERWHRDVDIVKTRAEELGYDVEVVNSYEDSNKQVEQIRALIKEGADAILILPHDKDELSEVVAEAKRQDIIVIAYDRLIANANVDAYVSFDNFSVGEKMAIGMIDQVPKGNFIIVNGAPEDNNSTMIHEGFHEVLNSYVDSGDITIIEEIWAPNWREDFAYNIVNKVLQEGIQLDGVLCANDLLAEGAISALAEYRMAGEVFVVGQDANISACQRVVEGKQLMTVYKPLKNLAEGAVELVDQMRMNGPLEVSITINDGSYDVPYVHYEVIPVFKENMRETVIRDFFHSEEDIYLQSSNEEGETDRMTIQD